MTKEQNYVNDQVKEYMKLVPADKYHHPGIYSITVGDEIVYVGKARDMQVRVAVHMYEINCSGEQSTKGKRFKYGELKRAINNGYNICFNVLYTSPFVCGDDTKKIDDDIGPQEAYYINKYMPKLNKQIPDLQNYHKYKNKNYELLNIEERTMLVL